MSAEDAAKVAAVLAQADGGCYVCAGSLADQAMHHWPEHNWYALVGQAGDWSEAQMRPEERYR